MSKKQFRKSRIPNFEIQSILFDLTTPDIDRDRWNRVPNPLFDRVSKRYIRTPPNHHFRNLDFLQFIFVQCPKSAIQKIANSKFRNPRIVILPLQISIGVGGIVPNPLFDRVSKWYIRTKSPFSKFGFSAIHFCPIQKIANSKFRNPRILILPLQISIGVGGIVFLTLCLIEFPSGIFSYSSKSPFSKFGFSPWAIDTKFDPMSQKVQFRKSRIPNFEKSKVLFDLTTPDIDRGRWNRVPNTLFDRVSKRYIRTPPNHHFRNLDFHPGQ